MSGEYRPLLQIIFKNFINSFKFAKTAFGAKDIGKDYLGNTYHETPVVSNARKKKPARSYTPAKGKDFEEPIPAEWQAWLRMRRDDPPTEEEIATNLAVAQMKKENAAKIEQKRLAEGGSLPTVPSKGPQSYPKYDGIYSSGDAPLNKK